MTVREPCPWTVRGTTAEEYPEVARVLGEALLLPAETLVEHERRDPLVEHDRTLVALDGDRIVGTAASYALTLTVPGGPRPAAGVTGVGVWPTRRRRGVLTALMHRQLADVRARGENLAVLWASEGGIYGRFGYGLSSREARITVSRAHAALRPDAPRDPALTVDLCVPGETRAALAEVHRRTVTDRNGRFVRADKWWPHLLRDDERSRGDAGHLLAALVTGPDGPEGYALYRVRHRWDLDTPRARVLVTEVVTTTPAARVALYEHLFSRDLTVETVFHDLPLDDPLPDLLADRRQAAVTPFDGLWTRLVDLPGALGERAYAAPVDVALTVIDRCAPWNAGTWRLTVDDEGARCVPDAGPADLTVDVSHLGAAYFGRRPLAGFVGAGLVAEHTPGAARRLDTALYEPLEPHCGVDF
ncbi:GNAT family N-acetyltransferase [Nocardiopsis lambiniae]|uniref:GNAT family N-acetyltransferase n=1 Tax=Nocardiopsis lambiniae TaxID=3075539 RepID=A0ABU2MG79_9ACTN|nr:GNAT family N-acetyltransferase [Nocardiopsis sp. DSM 44743]MDT0331256.1 GNAT family N-acetyltransferase [Nocardiopsis sp. DSM 44743]